VNRTALQTSNSPASKRAITFLAMSSALTKAELAPPAPQIDVLDDLLVEQPAEAAHSPCGPTQKNFTSLPWFINENARIAGQDARSRS